MEDNINMFHEKIDWQKFYFSLTIIVSNYQPSHAWLQYLRKMSHIIEEVPGIWTMKGRLISTSFTYSISEHIIRNKLVLILDLMSTAFDYSVTIVKKIWSPYQFMTP